MSDHMRALRGVILMDKQYACNWAAEWEDGYT